MKDRGFRQLRTSFPTGSDFNAEPDKPCTKRRQRQPREFTHPSSIASALLEAEAWARSKGIPTDGFHRTLRSWKKQRKAKRAATSGGTREPVPGRTGRTAAAHVKVQPSAANAAGTSHREGRGVQEPVRSCRSSSSNSSPEDRPARTSEIEAKPVTGARHAPGVAGDIAGYARNPSPLST